MASEAQVASVEEIELDPIPPDEGDDGIHSDDPEQADNG